MKKTFLVMTDPEKGAREDNWTIMNAFEFARFMETEEGQRRKDCFEMLDPDYDGDGVLYIESGREAAAERKKEQNHSDYLRTWKEEKGFETISLDEPVAISGEGDETTLLELIADESANTEEMAIDGIIRKELWAALAGLDPVERDMMLSVYITNEDMTVYRYAIQHGLTVFSAYETHKRALRKLRFHFRVKKLI
ncbi:MAG: hypothetical protein IKE31_08685 [Eubacterium sp.]|nr:hypothetical protein [Eubacterium sp.]